MEADFSGLRLSTAAEVNMFHDRLEERIAETGEELRFFLVNYSRSRIESDAWFAFSRRGKTLNMAHSMGSVRRFRGNPPPDRAPCRCRKL